MTSIFRATPVLLALLLPPAPSFAQADYAREQRWADEVVPGIVVGDPVWIAAGSGRKFLAIWTPHPQPRGAVIVVHGLGLHPDWGLIGVLRSQLPDAGYATLSVQMPVAAAGAKADRYPPLFPEAAQRLAAAVEWLRGKGVRRVAIVSHSMGARMTGHFLAREGGVDAWVAIGMAGEFALPEKFRAPVLDLYGEHDYPGVLESVPGRVAAIRKIRGSGQVQVAGADHFFAGMEAELVRQVRQFLEARLRP